MRSSGSSSASSSVRLSWRIDASFLCGGLGQWHGHVERGARTGLGARADPAAVPFGDAAADRESHTRALVGVTAVEPLEHGEDLLGVLRLEADAVVLDPEYAELFVA